MFMGIALNFSTWYSPRVSRPYETFCSLLVWPGRRGWRQKSATQQKQLSCYKSLQTQAARISQNRLRVSNMLKKNHHHLIIIVIVTITYHQCGINFIISHRKISRMELEIFMIHLYTIATLMFLQNNISQKILFIPARTIQFPGVVLKYVSI